MARYIDADKLIKDIESKRLVFKDTTTIGEALLSQGNVIREAIEKSPTADVVEVKHGEWVEKDCITESNRGRTIHYVTNKCSVCGKWNGRHKSNYCPNCGAKMDGGKAK